MRDRLLLSGAMVFAAMVFFTGIQWGLPSAEVNRYLFGEHPVWTGQQIIDLAGSWDTNADLGADVDRNPLQRRDQIICVNETDAQRAEIVRRYRLFSYQPDEMITLRALSQIKPAAGQFDPKLYQYGGLWTYPVGVALKLASRFGWVELTPNVAFYLDHPEAFGRFYIVARGYSAMWGLAGVATVFFLVRKLSADVWLATIAAAGFAVLPVVVCMSHEAKPHLGGAVLVLLSILAAMRYLEQPSVWRGVLVGVASGAGVAMVPTSAVAFLLLPAMLWMTPNSLNSRLRTLELATAVGLAIFAVTNPYVVAHLFWHRELLRSNAGNTQAMYGVHGVLAGVANSVRLIGAGTGWLVLIAGVVGWMTLHFAPGQLRRQLILLALPAIATTGAFALVAAGKPGEFGRFFILPDTTLIIGVIVALSRWHRMQLRRGVAAVIVLVAATSGAAYLRGFVKDASGEGTRHALAQRIAEGTGSATSESVTIVAEPAPYCLPPVDLFKHRLLLLPISVQTPPTDGWFIHAVDKLPAEQARSAAFEDATVISWANKPFVVVRSR